VRRRRFLFAAAAFPLIECPTGKAATPAADLSSGWRRFEVTTRISLLQAPGSARLWLPLAQTVAGYQASLGLRWHGNGDGEIVRDPHYGAEMLRVSWKGGEPVASKTMEVVQTVTTRNRDAATPVIRATRAEQDFWLQPTDSLPTDGIVHETAMRIIQDMAAPPRQRLRALYDWVVAETTRNPATRGCGTGDISSMLRSGNLGGKCADINGLMTGLARAAGFPARDVYGVRVAPSGRFPCLGASGTISKAQHCRSEIYLDEAGWFPVDPADVRKVMLEQRLAAGSTDARMVREQMFGQWEMNWIGFNSATDMALPGAGPGQTPNFPFLMYPCAFTQMGQPDCLDPDSYRYEITSREVAA